MSLRKEIEWENDLCTGQALQGWHYAEGDASGYDRSRTQWPADDRELGGLHSEAETTSTLLRGSSCALISAALTCQRDMRVLIGMESP